MIDCQVKVKYWGQYDSHVIYHEKARTLYLALCLVLPWHILDYCYICLYGAQSVNGNFQTPHSNPLSFLKGCISKIRLNDL